MPKKERDLFEDAFVEKLLQLLIAVVDAKLLKTVHLEIFYNDRTTTPCRKGLIPPQSYEPPGIWNHPMQMNAPHLIPARQEARFTYNADRQCAQLSLASMVIY